MTRALPSSFVTLHTHVSRRCDCENNLTLCHGVKMVCSFNPDGRPIHRWCLWISLRLGPPALHHANRCVQSRLRGQVHRRSVSVHGARVSYATRCTQYWNTPPGAAQTGLYVCAVAILHSAHFRHLFVSYCRTADRYINYIYMRCVYSAVPVT